jgi:hypothetical protein
VLSLSVFTEMFVSFAYLSYKSWLFEVLAESLSCSDMIAFVGLFRTAYGVRCGLSGVCVSRTLSATVSYGELKRSFGA